MAYDIEIKIFGKVANPGAIWELAAVLAVDARIGWRGEISMNDFPGLFERAAEEKRALVVNRRAAGDLFDDVRNECQKAGLSYVMNFGEPGAEGFIGGMAWHPGMNDERTFLLTGEGPALLVADVRKAAARGVDAVNALIESTLNAQRVGRIEVEPGFAEAYAAYEGADEPASSPSV